MNIPLTKQQAERILHDMALVRWGNGNKRESRTEKHLRVLFNLPKIEWYPHE